MFSQKVFTDSINMDIWTVSQKNRYKKDSSRAAMCSYFSFGVNFLPTPCLYLNSWELVCFCWEGSLPLVRVISSCLRFRTAECLSAHSIESFVVRMCIHAFLWVESTVSSLTKSPFVWFTSCCRSLPRYQNHLLPSALSESFHEWYEKSPFHV